MRAEPLARLDAVRRLDAVGRLGRVARRLVGAPPSSRLDRRAGAALLAGAGVAVFVARLGPLAALVVWGADAARERRRRAAGRAQLVAEIADVVPLLQLAVGGGLTVRAALAAVVPWLDGSLGRGLAGTLDATRDGSLADGLDALGERLGPLARPLLAALAAADRYGAPLEAPLTQLASESRAASRRLAEEEARRVPVRLLFPLVAGVLPAFVLLTVVPLLVSSLQAVQRGAP